MFNVKPFCVFYLKNNGSLIHFTDASLKKCNEILITRKNNNLSLNNVKLSTIVNDHEKYHSKCYRLFTALPLKHRTSKNVSEKSIIISISASQVSSISSYLNVAISILLYFSIKTNVIA